MTIQEASQSLHVHERVLSKKLKSGEIAGTKAGWKWEISEEEVSRLLSERYEFNPEYLDVQQIANLLHKHPETVREFIRSGELSAKQDTLSHGGKLYVSRQNLETMQRILSQPGSRGPKH